MKYGKIIAGALHVPQNYPCSIRVGEKTVYNPTEEDYKAAGYLPISETTPEEVEGKVSVPSYHVEDGKIVQTWSYEDVPEGEPEEIQS